MTLDSAALAATERGLARASTSSSLQSARAQQEPEEQPPPAKRTRLWPSPSALLSPDAKFALAGGIAGATSKTCTAPLARLTILYQVEGVGAGGGAGAATAAGAGGAAGARPPPLPRSVPAALAALARREGVAALWRGNGVTILHRLPYSSINFWAYERCFGLLDAAFPEEEQPGARARGGEGGGGGGGDGSGGTSGGAGIANSASSSSSARAFAKRLAAGAVAGGVACAAAYPLDLVRTRLAAQVGGGAPSSSAASAVASPRPSLSAPAWPHPQHQHQPPSPGGLPPHSYSQPPSHRPPHAPLYYRGVWGTLATIWRDEGGAGGLYRGLGATLLQVVPTLGLNFGLYETSKAVLRRRRDEAAAAEAAEGARSGGGGGGGGQRGGGEGGGVAPPPAAATLACGCLSGFVTATATFPLDVVRRRMQVAGGRGAQGSAAANEAAPAPASSLGQPSSPASSPPPGHGHGRPLSYAQVAREVLRQGGGGLGGFYRGIGAEYCKVVPGVAIAFFVYESAKEALGVGSGGRRG